MSFMLCLIVGLISAGFYTISKYCWLKIVENEKETGLKSFLKHCVLVIVTLFANIVLCYTLFCCNGISLVFPDGEVLTGIGSNVSIYTEKVGN